MEFTVAYVLAIFFLHPFTSFWDGKGGVVWHRWEKAGWEEHSNVPFPFSPFAAVTA